MTSVWKFHVLYGYIITQDYYIWSTVGMGQVQNGCLYLRYGSSSVITTAMWDKTLTDKRPLLVYCKNAPRVLLPHTKTEKNNQEILILACIDLSSSFLSFFTALLLEMWLFRFRAACEPQLESYGPKHTSYLLSNMPFYNVIVCTFTYNSQTVRHILTFNIPNNFFSTIGDAPLQL